MNFSTKEEVWKDVEGYEGLYQVSNFGKVYSLPRAKAKGGVLKPQINKGYERVILLKERKIETFSVHRLVATHFIENPNKYEVINHIDENKANNFVDNLEWCTQAENLQKFTGKGKILQYDLNNQLIKIWNSSSEAQNTGEYDSSAIIKCCKGKRKTHKKSIWKYETP